MKKVKSRKSEEVTRRGCRRRTKDDKIKNWRKADGANENEVHEDRKFEPN